MSALADPKGLKRICTNCGTRFYDFNKSPIICPNCSTEFTGETKVRSRRGRAAANDTVHTPSQVEKNTAVEEETEEGEIEPETDDEVVSLDDVNLEGNDDMDDSDDLNLDEDLGDIDDIEDSLEDDDNDVVIGDDSENDD